MFLSFTYRSLHCTHLCSFVRKKSDALHRKLSNAVCPTSNFICHVCAWLGSMFASSGPKLPSPRRANHTFSVREAPATDISRSKQWQSGGLVAARNVYSEQPWTMRRPPRAHERKGRTPRLASIDTERRQYSTQTREERKREKIKSYPCSICYVVFCIDWFTVMMLITNFLKIYFCQY